jgi:hypothetical protein
VHKLFDTWTFDGNVDSPTFNPSFLIRGMQREVDSDGKWTGDWLRDANHNVVKFTCHFHLHAGILHFCSDSSHALSGKSIPLPNLPPYFQDHSDI